MSDPQSRLRRLAGRILREELRPRFPNLPPHCDRLLRRAARYQALAERLLDGIGSDPEATPRKLWALQKAVETQLRKLQSIAAELRKNPPPTAAELLSPPVRRAASEPAKLAGEILDTAPQPAPVRLLTGADALGRGGNGMESKS